MPKSIEGFRKIIRSDVAMQKYSETRKRLYREGKIFIPSRKGVSLPIEKRKIVKTNCKTCKKEFYNEFNRSKIGKGIFCSRECYATDQKGKKLPEITRKRISDAHVGKMPLNLNRFGFGKFSNVKRGYFDINGERLFFRSKWEANYALYLNFLIKQNQINKWEYEKDVFIFEKIQFGTRSYRPDFKIYKNDGSFEYHEIKGYMTQRSKTQIKRMAKYFPEVMLILITSKEYKELKSKIGSLLKFF